MPWNWSNIMGLGKSFTSSLDIMYVNLRMRELCVCVCPGGVVTALLHA